MRAAMKTADNFGIHGICEGKKPKTIAGVAIYMVVIKMKIRFDNE
jgi:transcription initiation factor TFIIIB Brf1 subunit/transcription initiation factor TFIIB